jgi:Cysteinyl-tRNA synthetase
LSGVLGIKDESFNETVTTNNNVIDSLMKMIIEERKLARENKDWSKSDMIRDRLKEAGIQLHDTKDGVEWTTI